MINQPTLVSKITDSFVMLSDKYFSLLDYNIILRISKIIVSVAGWFVLHSLTRLVDFLKHLMTNFHTKVDQIFGDHWAGLIFFANKFLFSLKLHDTVV